MSAILAKLSKIQRELNAPKTQYNNFGKYSYRSCEDILGAVKELLEKTQTALTITDTPVQIGERIYIKAEATLWDAAEDAGKTEGITVTAYAREQDVKKGMDEMQVTGCASSYARKYALNGLFAIDDTKDADSQEPEPPKSHKAAAKKPQQPQQRQNSQPLTCEKCGAEIGWRTDIHGKKWSPQAIANGTRGKYGQQLCWECSNAMKGQNNG